MFDRRHRDAAIQLLVDDETSPELAARIDDLNVAAPTVSPRTCRLSPAGFRNVLELRAEFSGFEATAGPRPARLAAGRGLYDLGYYRGGGAELPDTGRLQGRALHRERRVGPA
ncbi:hypothetical protein ACRAWF_40120 [Streptomyces sp. L7]